MQTADLAPELVNRLNLGSVRRRFYPYDTDVIDWSVPITSDYMYMPESISMFTGWEAFERLDQEAKSFLTRWEITQTLRNIGHGEHLLNQGLLMSLWRTSQYDPSWRYALHEVAEECQHMMMFNEWIRLNPDIRTYGVREDVVGPALGLVGNVTALFIPEANWVLILLFEVVGDVITTTLGNDRSETLHPILKQIGRAHAVEEARHIAFAKAWLRTRLETLWSPRVYLLQRFTERLARRLLLLRRFLPLPYNPQVAKYMTDEDFRAARSSPRSTAKIREHIHETIGLLVDLGLVREKTLTKWERKGILDPTLLPSYA